MTRAERRSRAAVPAVGHLRLRLQAALLPRARPVGGHDDDAVPDHRAARKLVEGQYRRRFDDGGFDVGGVVAFDDGLGDNERRAARRRSPPPATSRSPRRASSATSTSTAASDDSFLAQFDYTDADRLTSIAGIHRTRAQRVRLASAPSPSRASIEDEDDRHVPFVFPQLTYRRLLDDARDRRAALGIDGQLPRHPARRGSNMFRAGGGVDWHPRLDPAARRARRRRPAPALSTPIRSGTTPTSPDGLRPAVPLARASCAGRWSTHDRDRRSTSSSRSSRWSTRTPSATHDVPNEDSQLPEFDETNLFSLNRFPGRGPAGDRAARQPRDQLHPAGSRPAGRSGLTLGRVLRADHEDEFSEGTGLAGTLVGLRRRACRCDFAWGLSLVNRSLFDDELRLPPQRVRPRLRRRARRPARGLRLPRAGRHRSVPRAPARDQRDRPRRPLPAAAELGAARALALRRGDQHATCARGRESPTATSARSSTFRSRAAIRHRTICRPRPRSAFSLQLAGFGDERRNQVAGAGLHARSLTAGRSDDAHGAAARSCGPRGPRGGPGGGPVLAANPYAPALTVNIERDHPLRHRPADEAPRRARRHRRPAASSRSSS